MKKLILLFAAVLLLVGCGDEAPEQYQAPVQTQQSNEQQYVQQPQQPQYAPQPVNNYYPESHDSSGGDMLMGALGGAAVMSMLGNSNNNGNSQGTVVHKTIINKTIVQRPSQPIARTPVRASKPFYQKRSSSAKRYSSSRRKR